MRFILTLLFANFVVQAAAEDVVYEFTTPTHEIFLACDGDNDDEKSFAILERNYLKWNVRLDGLGVLPIIFDEKPGPEIIYENLSSDEPVKVKFDLRNYDAPKFILVTMGATEVTECQNITEQIKFFTGKIDEQQQNTGSKELVELNNKVRLLQDEIETMKLAQLALDSLDEQQIEVRLNFLCAYLKDRFPQEYNVLTRKRIPTATGLVVVCKTRD